MNGRPLYVTLEKLCLFVQSDEVYLEAQIQNITPGPIYMEHVSLEPSPQYTTTQLNTLDEKDK